MSGNLDQGQAAEKSAQHTVSPAPEAAGDAGSRERQDRRAAPLTPGQRHAVILRARAYLKPTPGQRRVAELLDRFFHPPAGTQEEDDQLLREIGAHLP